MSEEQNKKPQFELRETGEIYYNKGNNSTLLAKYNEENGILTFETFQIDSRYRSQICRAVMEDVMTGELRGNVIRAFAIKDRPKDRKMAGEPPRPRWDPSMGDKTPAYVKWLYRWRPQAFYARFGVHLDSNGEPRTAHCRRIEQGLLRPQEGSGALQVLGDGKDAMTENVLEDENGILARRATCLTFLPAEQVGVGPHSGLDEDDPFDTDTEEPLADDDGEPAAVGTDQDEAPKPRRGRRPKSIDEVEPE